MPLETGTGKYEQLLRGAKAFPPVPTAVAHPCDATSLAGAVEAAKLGLIVPILVGPRAKIAEPPRLPGSIWRSWRSSMPPTAMPRLPRRSSWSAKAGPKS